MATTASHRLAEYVCDVSFDAVPAPAIAMLKTVLLHDLAIAIAGSRTDEAARALTLVDAARAREPVATVIASGRKTDPEHAAFANAVLIRALRQEDTILPARIHAGPLLFPTALAFAERLGSSGRDVLTAIIAGYEVMAKVSGDGYVRNQDYRTPSHVYGAFGPAVVVAKLLRFDAAQTATAIAYAGNLGAMITAGFENHQYGVVVRNGITAAQLGMARAPAPDDALEGNPGFFRAQCGGVPDALDDQLDRLGENDAVVSSILKAYPCTAITQVPVHLLRHLLHANHVAADDVTAVAITRPLLMRGRLRVHDKGPWVSASRAISSVPFAIAATLLDGDVTRERLHDSTNVAVLERAQLVHIDFEEGDNATMHRVEIRTTDGRTLSATGDVSVLVPPDPDETIAALATDIIGTDRVDRLRDAVSRLETLDSVAELTDCLA